MNDTDRFKLLHGPYQAPTLHCGDGATCLFRDADVVITGWSAARIPWPRRIAVGRRGGSGLLVDDELARAIRCESSLALQHWFGVKEGTVWRWRKAFGVQRFNEGSARLHADVTKRAVDATRGKPLPADQVERRRQTARTLGLRPTGRWKGEGWTKRELRLLGKLPDADVAAKIGRTENAVRVMRTRHGIAKVDDGRKPATKGKVRT